MSATTIRTAAEQQADQAPTVTDRSARASVTAWLGVLFVLVVLLVALGGFVRLTGSGLSLPGWPTNAGLLLPPMTEVQWDETYALFREDQARLQDLQGKPGLGSLGHDPQTRAEFIRMYLIEWSHRALAALVGIVALACCVVGWRNRWVRSLAGERLAAIVALMVFQAVLGGVLVLEGTATHWLFLHLGTATIILALICETVLRLLRATRPAPQPELLAGRRPLLRLFQVAFAAIFLQLVLGALVAGSRHNGFVPNWPLMQGELVPTLWQPQAGVLWNLLDNWILHQWLHRWFAWISAGLVLVLGVLVLRRDPTPRLALAARIVLTFLAIQMLLGVMNVVQVVPTLIALSHLVMAMLLVAALVLLGHDLRWEPRLAVCEQDRARRRVGPEGVQPC
ncbi:MAG: COX15/CtaA family protein [Planctomycetota bacterium]